MSTSFTLPGISTIARIISPSSTSMLGAFELKALDGFPYTDWTNMQERYSEFQTWYSGEALNETVTVDGKTVEKYPIHLNPLENTCEKHAILLLGNNIESIREGNIPIRFSIKNKKPAKETLEADKTAAEIINDALVDAFQEHGSGAMFVSNAILSQYLGGCVFGVSWRKNHPDNKVQVFAPLPTEFIGIPSGTNPWLLREAWYLKEITAEEAIAYGMAVRDMEIKYWYIEHWTEGKYKVTINDQVINLDGQPWEGTNPFGTVPFVYIPHIRVRGFYGESIINSTIKGLIREMNLRFADTGDAISEDSHVTTAARNIRDSVAPMTLPNGRTAVNIGSSPGISASEKEPDLFAVKTDSASEPMLKFGDKLITLYRKEARHPAVADGEDEGSQRSSLTLTTRMWPLVSHADLERINWTTGLIKLAKIILTICSVKKYAGINDTHIKNYDINIKWALSLPRDRDQLINELAIRKKNKLGSTLHLISMLDDVEDVDMELQAIKDEIEEESARALENAEKTANAKNGATGEDVKNPSADDPKAKANNLPKQG